MPEKDFIKDHIIFVSIPKYDWNKIAEDKEKEKLMQKDKV
jgi:hypothetical protein